MPKLLTKDEIFAVDDLKTQRVHVSDWHGDVFLRCMSAQERIEYEAEFDKLREAGKAVDQLEIILLFLQKVIVDKAGDPLFGADDLEALRKKNWKVLYEIFEKAQEINALSDEDVEELAKNLETAPGSGSPSSSPESSEE
jgi:hypothetical protein